MKRAELIDGVVIFIMGGVTRRFPQDAIGTLRMAGSGLFPLCLGIALMLLRLLRRANSCSEAPGRGRCRKAAAAPHGPRRMVRSSGPRRSPLRPQHSGKPSHFLSSDAGCYGSGIRRPILLVALRF
jgi:hypothetical protein